MAGFVEWCQTRSERWTQYDVHHLILIAIFVGLAVLAGLYIKKLNEKQFRLVVGVLWGVIVVFEVLKQIYFNCSVEDGRVTYELQWYIAPYVFCSTPYYVLPFVIFGKEGKVRDGAIAFCSTYTLIAGALVFFFFLDSCLLPSLLINLQTSIHHGVMFLTGVCLSFYYSKKIKLKNFALGIVVFLVLSAIAVLINECLHGYELSLNGAQTINAFHISRFHDCPLAVVGQFWKAGGTVLQYIGFLMIYNVGFTAMAGVVFGIQMAVKAVYKAVKK